MSRAGIRRTYGTILGAVLAFIVLPLVVIVWVSFFANRILAFPASGYTLDWYARALDTDAFRDGFVTSVETALFATAASLASACGEPRPGSRPLPGPRRRAGPAARADGRDGHRRRRRPVHRLHRGRGAARYPGGWHARRPARGPHADRAALDHPTGQRVPRVGRPGDRGGGRESRGRPAHRAAAR